MNIGDSCKKYLSEWCGVAQMPFYIALHTFLQAMKYPFFIGITQKFLDNFTLSKKFDISDIVFTNLLKKAIVEKMNKDNLMVFCESFKFF